MNSPDPKVSQGNACVNVTDFFSVGGGACRVVRLNVCDHLTSCRTRPASVEEGLNSVMSAVSVDDSEAY